jgi:hypothetical protein
MVEIEERKHKEEEAKIIAKTANRNKEKAKKKRMKENDGVDPEEKVTRVQQMRKEQDEKHHHHHHHHHHHEEEGGDDEGSSSGSESYDSYSSDGSYSSDDDADDIRLDFDPESDTMAKRDADSEARALAAEFKRQAKETKRMLLKMGYDLNTKRCAACGGKSVDRPIDYWTGEPKGGKKNQWYVVGDQTFCYPCANNAILMKGVAKAIAIQNGMAAEDGIKNFGELKKLKFQFE